MNTVLFAKEAITCFSSSLIPQLKEMALQAPLRRARFCLHHSPEDDVQEMVIVLHRESYIRPHRHQKKTESFHMIEGEVAVVFFDDEGKMMNKIRLKADPSACFLYRLAKPFWHSVVSLSEFAVFHEVSTGPFEASEFPIWEPTTTESIALFRQGLEIL